MVPPVLLPTSKVMPRKPVPSTIPSMRRRPPLSSSTPPQTLKEGAWVRVKRGWLTGRAEPTSEKELESWGADVVISLQDRSAGHGKANRIVAAAASASVLLHQVFPIQPICRAVIERSALLDVVWWGQHHLAHGLKVLLHGRHGQHRTGVAIYLLLRSIFDDPVQCLSMMKEMRPIMHAELLRKTANRYLFHKAETIFESPEVRAGVTLTVT